MDIKNKSIPDHGDPTWGVRVQDDSDVDEIRIAARKVQKKINQVFLNRRESVGAWKDPKRGEGLHITLEALDTIFTQSHMTHQPLKRSDLYSNDFEQIKEHILGPPKPSLGRAFPLASFADDKRSSAETAALALRVMNGFRRHQRKFGIWPQKMAAEFEAVAEPALEFLLSSFKVDANGMGGWGIYPGSSPHLYFTSIVARALVDFATDEHIDGDTKHKIIKCLNLTHKFLLACKSEGKRFSKNSRKDSRQDTYSSIGLLGMVTLWDWDRLQAEPTEKINVKFSEDILPVFEWHRASLTAEDRYDDVLHYLGTSGGTHHDSSRPWSWVRATMLWLDRSAQFFDDKWQRLANQLVAALINHGRLSGEIYLWNRAVLALASYEAYSEKNWTISNYHLRRAVYNLFQEPSLARHAYTSIKRSLGKGDL